MITRIDSFSGQYRFLSNFFPANFTWRGLAWTSSECAYQAAKSLNPNDWLQAQSMTPGQAKRFGKTVTMRPDWEQIKFCIMAEICKEKFTQNPELLVLDDFSLGLDPGYRRLFVDYLRDYARSENKTVFLTSHIIQDMERLVDDCIIMDYGRILIQQPVKELLDTIRRYTCTLPEGYKMPEDKDFYHPSLIRNTLETFSFLPQQEVENRFKALQVPYSDLKCETVNLEDAFIGLTGKY